MYADRHARSSGLDPRSLAIAVALNGAAVAALLLASPVLEIVRHPTELKTFIVPETPPPPDLPPPEAQPRPSAARTTMVAPRTEIELPLQPSMLTTTTEIAPLPPISTATATDTGPAAAASAEPLPLPLVGAEVDPRFAGDLQPPYPPGELRAEREGVVVVRVLIGVDGRVREVEPVSATSDAFLAATRAQALRRWRFRPATRGSVPVEGWREMRIRFVIPG